MSVKGFKIERGPMFWHVSIKHTTNNQGYVEIDKFLTLEMATAFINERMKGIAT